MNALAHALVCVLLISLLLVLHGGCAPSIPTIPRPVAVMPSVDAGAVTAPAPDEITDPGLDGFAAVVARARAALATAQANQEAALEATRRATQARAEAPLRGLLSWALYAGGALALLGVLALGVALTPWASWIPGGKTTAGIMIVTGGAVLIAAQAMTTALSLAWLPWLVLALGALVALAYVAWQAVRLVARHADRVEPAISPGEIAAAKAQSASEQARAGLRGIIQVVRGRP